MIPFDTLPREQCFIALAGSKSLFQDTGIKDADHVMSEAWFQRAMRGGGHGVQRVKSPTEADLIYLPVLPFMSTLTHDISRGSLRGTRDHLKGAYMGGELPKPCKDMTSHNEHMQAAAGALKNTAQQLKSLAIAGKNMPPFLIVAGGWPKLSVPILSMHNESSAELRLVFGNTETFTRGWVGRRSPGLPYFPNPDLTRLGDSPRNQSATQKQGQRSITIFSLGKLSRGVPHATSSFGGQKIRLATAAWSQLPGTYIRFAGSGYPPPPLLAWAKEKFGLDGFKNLMVDRLIDGESYASLIRNSTFCVVPHGDTATTRKLYGTRFVLATFLF